MDASARKQFELQAQVRHNAEQFKSVLSGLQNWTKDIKQQDGDLQKCPSVSAEIVDAQEQQVRSHIQTQPEKSDHSEKDMKNNMKNAKKRDDEPPIETPPSPLQLKHQEANKSKDRGNSFVKLGDYSKAIAEYSKAIDLFPTDAVYFMNRALCYLKLELYQECIDDCDYAISLNKFALKAYYRRMQANESLGNALEALKDCTTILTIDPKNVEAKRSHDRINGRIKKQAEERNQPSFSPCHDDLLDIIPLDKPPHKRSKNPLLRIPITNIVGSKTLKNFENQQLDISDEDIDKLFNSNCGPFVEVKKGDESRVATTKKTTKPTTNETKQLQPKKQPMASLKDEPPKNHTATKVVTANATTTTIKDTVSDRDNSQQHKTLKPEKETNVWRSSKTIKDLESKAPKKPERPLPATPSTTAQFYAIWKDLSASQQYEYLKSIELHRLSKIIGAGFDSSTFTDILYVLHDYYLPNKEPLTAETLYEISKNVQVSILIMLMSKEEQQILRTILAAIRANTKMAEFAEKIEHNLQLKDAEGLWWRED